MTAAAEAQAGTGHDIMSHRDWNIRIHQNVLEPLDDVVDGLIKQYGAISPVVRISRQDQGHVARRADHGGQPGQAVLLAIRSLSAARRHRSARDVPGRRIEIRHRQNRQLELGHLSRLGAEALQGRLPGRACRWARSSDAVDWVGAMFNSYGVVMVDAKDNIKIDSDETRAAMEMMKKLMAVNPPEVYAWDDAGNNRWLISGKGSSIMNPPSAWAVAKRDNPRWRRIAGRMACRGARRAASSGSCRSSTACGRSPRTSRRRRTC